MGQEELQSWWAKRDSSHDGSRGTTVMMGQEEQRSCWAKRNEGRACPLVLIWLDKKAKKIFFFSLFLLSQNPTPLGPNGGADRSFSNSKQLDNTLIGPKSISKNRFIQPPIIQSHLTNSFTNILTNISTIERIPIEVDGKGGWFHLHFPLRPQELLQVYGRHHDKWSDHEASLANNASIETTQEYITVLHYQVQSLLLVLNAGTSARP